MRLSVASRAEAGASPLKQGVRQQRLAKRYKRHCHCHYYYYNYDYYYYYQYYYYYYYYEDRHQYLGWLGRCLPASMRPTLLQCGFP